MASREKTSKLVLTALMMGIILIATMFIKVPIPFTQGYAHLGDAMIFLSVLLLGKRYGAVAAAFGSAMGDVLGGFAIWAPWTFLIKGLMALLMGAFIEQMVKKNKHHVKLFGVPVIEIAGMALAGIEMVTGYYLAEGFIYGNWATPILGVPWNIGQFAVGMVIATALATALYKTSMKNIFAIKKIQ